jgi:hypothetical protein
MACDDLSRDRAARGPDDDEVPIGDPDIDGDLDDDDDYDDDDDDDEEPINVGTGRVLH